MKADLAPATIMALSVAAVGCLMPFGRFRRSQFALAVNARLLVAVLALYIFLPQAHAAVITSAEELRARLRDARPGEVLAIAAGEWRDVDLLIEARGTSAAPIAVIAQRPGQTVLTGRSRVRIAGEYVHVSGFVFRDITWAGAVVEFRRDAHHAAFHSRLTDCQFENCNPPESSETDGRYLSLYGASNRVDHCEFTGKRSPGTTCVVWLNSPDDGRHQIDFNHFGPRPPLGRNGGETIRIGDSQTSMRAARCVVESNLFEECNGEAEIISNKSCENTYRHNTFRRCSGALTLRHGDRCIVDGNWFLGERARGTGGVRVIGAEHRITNNYFADLEGNDARAALCVMTGLDNSPLHGYVPVKDVLIAHNTLLNCKESLVVGYADRDVRARVVPRECLVVNNIVSSRRGPLIRHVMDPVKFRYSRNLLHGAPSGLVDDSEQILADPQMELADDGLMRPAATSPVLAAADDRLISLADDIDGQIRSIRTAIGCDQPSTGPILFRPLRPGDVGPGWQRPPAGPAADN